MKNVCRLGFILCCLSSSVFAEIFSTQSYGETEAYAREQVISHLASSLYVQIESESISVADNVSGLSSSHKVKLTTNLPVLGAQIDCYPKTDEYTCHGLLDGKASAPLYVEKLKALDAQIKRLQTGVGELPQREREKTLSKAISLIDEWERVYQVLALLSPPDVTGITLSTIRSELSTLLSQSQNISDSLLYAAKQIVSELAVLDVYVYPATFTNSREITPFAQQLKVQLESQLAHRSATLVRSKYLLKGEYFEHEKGSGITVNYSLQDQSGDIQGVYSVRLAPKAYKHLRYQPQAIDFDQLLHSGYVVSSDFSVQLRTNRGMRDLAFSAGDTVELFVKLNQPGYFYLLGHTKNPKNEKSYLLDLQDAPGNRKFIQYVNADDANRWISLGEFEVEPPFGVESLQVIGVASDPTDLLPSTRFDGAYYVVADKVTVGVSKTRGLVKKKKKTKDIKPAEAVIMFTTLP
jgi:hypothetical protein